ncbi:uncharacterized protein LOC131318895 [Rhododendron vialii]|uniref:uncharacterized protein LOC131318895 n=1 Tax=Rhododendron vialii TaxID=182163 RepID=UPI00265FB28A|nr:uncharacterized protein LOC131318895 [Rhododendron vialii]XP_058204916.1 uncharacterized protein LOC131318895 [Rhododendron vialii]XP_058204917.1 uncharacterized protein LOC131318895 [Rhododendron vialii]
MAGVLNLAPPPIFRPIPIRRHPKTTRFSIRSSAEVSETPLAAVSTKEEEESKLRFSAPPNFKPPQPKRFSVRPDKILDIMGAALALFFRLGTGALVSGYSGSLVAKNEIPPDKYALEIAGFKLKETSKLGPRPEKPIEIYEFESCPFCRKVREIVAVLDLDVLFYPCPRNGPNFRPKVGQMGGKQQFPYMVDPNTRVAMYESDDIIKYLVGKYGDGNVPFMLSLGLLTTLTEGFAMIGRMGKGSSYTPSKLPPKPLEVWAYEPSPFCKIVREVLVELELPHLLRSCARGSPKRQILYEKAGHFQVPYLEDPNTGVQMFESAEIVEYLRATYTL